MSASEGKFVRTIALLMTAGLALGLAAATPTSAADRGEACCKDLDERISELEATTVRTRPVVVIGRGDKDSKEKDEGMTLKITGIVNHAILAWHDGFESNSYIVDSPQDGTAFTLEGEVGLKDGWKAGFVISLDVLVASSDTVDQFRSRGERDKVEVSDSFWFVSQEKLGTVRLGLTDTATDGIDNINLSDSNVAADVEVNNWIASFFLRSASGELLTELRWGDFFPPVAGDTANVITYVSPVLKGFEASASWGRDDYWDVALRYSKKFHEVLLVKAGIGYYRNRSEEDSELNGVFEPIEDEGWGASLALRHIPTGLNIAVNYGTLSHTKRCSERGLVSGKCRGDDEFYYVKGGIIQKLFSWGNTAFYGEYYRGTRALNDSGADKVAALALNDNEALELRRSVATVWGLGVVQKIDDLEKKEKKGKNENGADPKKQEEEQEGKDEDAPIELYLGYRRYDLDVDLLGESGAAVPSKKINDFNAVMTGARIRF